MWLERAAVIAMVEEIGKETLNLWENLLFEASRGNLSKAEESVRAIFPEISKSISRSGASQLVMSTEDILLLEALAILYYNTLSSEAQQRLEKFAEKYDSVNSAVDIGKMNSPNGETPPALTAAMANITAEAGEAGT